MGYNVYLWLYDWIVCDYIPHAKAYAENEADIDRVINNLLVKYHDNITDAAIHDKTGNDGYIIRIHQHIQPKGGVVL